MKWTDSIPFYVTRETAGGEIYTYAISAWISLLGISLIWINILLWGLVGLIIGVQTLIGTVT